jgi:hypothetical protein
MDSLPVDAPPLGAVEAASLAALLADGVGVAPLEQAPRTMANPARALPIRNLVFMVCVNSSYGMCDGRSDRPIPASEWRPSPFDRSATHGRVRDSSG